jgi:hypothetical protein
MTFTSVINSPFLQYSRFLSVSGLVAREPKPVIQKKRHMATDVSLLGEHLIRKAITIRRPCASFLTEHHATKAYCGNGGITPRIL